MLVLVSKPDLGGSGGPLGSSMAYLLGIASEHRVDQLDPVGQAAGNHVAWAVGRPDPLAPVAGSELLTPPGPAVSEADRSKCETVRKQTAVLNKCKALRFSLSKGKEL